MIYGVDNNKRAPKRVPRQLVDFCHLTTKVLVGLDQNFNLMLSLAVPRPREACPDISALGDRPSDMASFNIRNSTLFLQQLQTKPILALWAKIFQPQLLFVRRPIFVKLLVAA